MKKFKWHFNKGALSAILFCTILLGAGCTTTDVTQPSRSASEQLLLSTAADRAMATAYLSDFKNQRVFLDTAYFEGYDSKYAVGTIRDAISRAGALLVETNSDCDIIIEARSGALAIDGTKSLVGIPSTGVPVPLSGAIALPEIAIYKSEKQFAKAKFALLAYGRESREHVYSSGPLVGRAYNKNFKLLGVLSWVATDIPEKKKKSKAAKEQVWFPQYDLTNLPAIKNTGTNSASTNSASSNEASMNAAASSDSTNAPLPALP